MSSYVQVALPVPLFKTFTYSVPPEFADQALLGMRVSVPFGRRTMTGIVVDTAESTDLEKVRPLADVLDTDPLFTPLMIRFAEWMSRYYVSPLGETIRAMLPQGMAPESAQHVAAVDGGVVELLPELRRTAPRQAAILRALCDHPNGVTVSFLRKKVGSDSLYSQLAALEEKGLVVRSVNEPKGSKPKTARGVRIAPDLLADEERMHMLLDELDARAPKQAALMILLYTQAERTENAFTYVTEVLKAARASDSALKALEGRGAVEIEQIEVSREEILAEELDSAAGIIDGDPNAIVPNHDQQRAIEPIVEAIDRREFKSFLLHGVTGSGKTQVYIETIKHTLGQGRTALMLVPEIALTVQLVERFRAVFGDKIAVMHSRMSEGERFDSWRRAAAGGCRVVIGARSALFAPLHDIGLIVVDEEHEASYKQYDAQPRYNARDSAVVRASIEGAVVVLGSATPSIESYYNARRGKYSLLTLPERVDNAKEPEIVIVDTTTARRQNLMRGSLSVRLLKDMRERLERKEGVILFQNRRGFATRLECTVCSHSPTCPHCAVTLTFHKRRGELRCHYCGYARKADRVCEICGNHDLRQPGVGTQKVEEELEEHLPEARVVRMDLDTTSRKGAHREILEEFGAGKVDILIGTQMVAKGLDFPRVSLVGVVSADTQLLLPDFRASERTYQLLTQVSGRAGRRGDMQGEVVIQTGHPDDPAVVAAFRKDYHMMYNNELLTRRELNYPPFSRFIVIEFRSEDETEAQEHARVFRRLLPSDHAALQILGPSPALISKLRNYFRHQIVVKNSRAADPGGKLFSTLFTRAFDMYMENHAKKSVQLIVDVDAQGMG